eukprot:SAG31_NODE_5990_length_2224_cov_1.195294_1_plen_187_part_00
MWKRKDFQSTRQVRGYFLVFVQLFEQCATLLERYTALIEKVSALIAFEVNDSADLRDGPRRCRLAIMQDDSLRDGLLCNMRALVALQDPKRFDIMKRVLIAAGATMEQISLDDLENVEETEEQQHIAYLQGFTTLFVEGDVTCEHLPRVLQVLQQSSLRVYKAEDIQSLIREGQLNTETGQWELPS